MPLASDGGVVDGFGPLVLTGARGEVSRAGSRTWSTWARVPSELTSTRPLADTEIPSPCGCGGSVTVPVGSKPGKV